MHQPVILYVEDEESDVYLMRIALQQADVQVRLITVSNGQTAVDYLLGTGEYADRQRHPLPELVLLDLNLPRMHGLKVLQWIREQPAFASLPVVIYTSSEQPRDIAAAQQLGAHDYRVKPSAIEAIAEAVKNVMQRWLS